VTAPGGGPGDGAEEPIRLPIEEALDLHTFAPRDVPGVVAEYLEECGRLGFVEVRLIHGRGTGTQRAVVRGVLARHPAVESYADAPPEQGGWGATIVRLRPRQAPDLPAAP
jgi:dsDNA-specific endonuclease/ATPase MutS2